MTLALPKPTRDTRKRANFDTSDMPLAKQHFDRSADYRAWIRGHRCLLAWAKGCEGPVESAHMQRGGRGVKGSDFSCVSLCRAHHGLLDGNSLDWEVTAYLWMKSWEFLAQWIRRTAA